MTASSHTQVTTDSSGGAIAVPASSKLSRNPSNSAAIQPGGKTLKYQDKLPHLPIPPLEDTCKRYLRALEALQSPEEHAQTIKVVEDFKRAGGEGERLTKQLQAYAEKRASYIEEFWDDAYLSHSDSVVLSLNPFFILEDDPTPSRGSQLMRATSLVLASLGFIHDLRTGELEPDMFRGTPLDMYQYTRLFGTSRIPTKTGCKMQVDPEARHIVVMRRGQFFWFEVLDSQHRPCLTERALLLNLQAIIAEADKTPPNQVAQGAIGVLSTENRKVWADLRDTLSSDKGNKSCLDVVDRALFILCLDDAHPDTASEMCNNMLCGTYKLEKGVQVGTCTNRYYDKLQIIVAANGAAGVNFEHSGVDGHSVLRFVADVYLELILRFAKSINPQAGTLFKAQTSPWAVGGGKKPTPNGKAAEDGDEEEHPDTTPKKLVWHLTPEVKTGVRFAETRLSDLICQNEVVALDFDGYGKNFITRHGFSPDAFVQMAFQAAYFSLYGRTESTYEPAMTKTFLHGRTEAIRTVQPESVKFVKAYCSDSPARDKINALRAACKTHTELTKKCAAGQGQDRVLYAMYCLASRDQDGSGSSHDSTSDEEHRKPLPALFRDPGYATLNHTTISTSNCGNPCLRLFGFGPVVPDGFGIGYIIKDDAVSIVASSKHLQTQRYLDTLRAYFLDCQRLILQLHRQANERPSYSMGSAGHTNGIDTSADDEDETSGYGFYDVIDYNAVKKEQKLRYAPVGTRLQLNEY
ncbi:uncharacterized protein L969DRAFT_299374 [Mixia osmundae IAM 14324]|uniref:Choline/carnitine acyltransferase domain-containing protein n=1 Tax=Mixia osmundae (strain CBS 9802 / IAM 14324 / JCM 22182 / KY 12970) TaxID=764103 RepID=G7DXZ0_MIXOS|nr:uncharacterized protein L969DRAFT_299374 [Mixia osmundae IAM 14324]KEI41351.1 hypothetical protein L969DRAFT_299374 [Mixia osmundae IAM 14324]GAA95450.1 hypothetical protein E5Q_02104 [Mixia osmundae IAM 14324]